MRRVACYCANSKLRPRETWRDALSSLEGIVREWIASKGRVDESAGHSRLHLADGRVATIATEKFELTDGKVVETLVTEPTETGTFLTRIVLGGSSEGLGVFIELRVGGEALHLHPLPVDARCPEVYRRIIDSREWFTGATIVRSKPLPFVGVRRADPFMRILNHVDRNLPLVVVSTVGSEALSRDLPTILAHDLAGVAIVATIDERVSWEVTQKMGKEWSCYNKGIRLFWPTKGHADKPFRHPLWTAQKLLASMQSPDAAASILRRTIRRQLLALSTYTLAEPELLTKIRFDAAEARVRELRARAEESGDWQELAEESDRENRLLKQRIADLENTVSGLKDQVASLLEAFRYQERPEQLPEILPDAEPEIENVSDAVKIAKHEFANELVFGEDVDDGVLSLAQDAGPPEKIYDYLRTLAEMVRIRRQGKLGKDMLAWLKDQGIKASIESETVMRSSAEMRKRTWGAGGGTRRKFEKHLKPSEATGPDRCVRIYFDYDDSTQRAIIGWVGRHP